MVGGFRLQVKGLRRYQSTPGHDNNGTYWEDFGLFDCIEVPQQGDSVEVLKNLPFTVKRRHFRKNGEVWLEV